MKPIIIKNACIITGAGSVYPNGSIYMRDGKIATLGTSIKTPRASDTISIDAGGRYVLPGFINPHMHLYSALACGMQVSRMRSFGQVLEGLWWKLDRALTLEEIYVSALLGSTASIRAGVTTIFDHHASYGAIMGSLGAISKAISETGLRACLCFEISDRNGRRARDMALDESASWLEVVRTEAHTNTKFMQRGMVGLHASMTLSDSSLSIARELMNLYGVGAHVHVAEGMQDVKASRKEFGLSPVARFAKAGILNNCSIAAHCVHTDDRDINLLSKRDLCVAHNPLSNLNNAVGIAPILKMVHKGVACCVGTDGMSASVAGDIKLASVVHKIASSDAQAGWDEMRYMVWSVAPWIASSYFGCDVGVLRKGAAADVIVMDAVPDTPLSKENALGHLLFRILDAPVRTTIVGGRIRMRDFMIKGVDELDLAQRAHKLAKALWRRI
ncbi:MAG: putative aminohydrolase SsnA [Pseudomonadota bacterium]